MSADYDPTDPTEKTPLITGGGGNDDDDEWQFPPPDADPNTTQPFEPGASSTPSGGENIPMTTRLPKEQQGASGGTAETSFIKGGAQGQRVLSKAEMLRREVQDQFPNASFTELDFRYTKTGDERGLIIEVKYTSKDSTWKPLSTKSRGDVNKTLNQSLSGQLKKALGKLSCFIYIL